MDKIKKIASSVKGFVVEHDTAVVTTTMLVLHVAVCHKYNKFLKEHDLFDEYFGINEK